MTELNLNDQKMLITGADGFIGSHLTERLVGAGVNVRAFCLYNSQGSLGWLDTVPAEVRRKLDVRLGDVRDSRFVETACEGIDVVFHLAALIAIPYSYLAPESFIDTNVKGTLNVLEAARKNGCLRVIHTSTSEVYGTPQHVPIRETHQLQAQSPYSASKIAADKLCEAYFCSFGVPVVVIRPFNTFGPRQSARAVLPTILVQLLAGKRQVKLGSLEPKRDLTFVEDTVDGFIRAAVSPDIEGEVIHLGTGQAVSVGDLFSTACRLLGVDAEVITDVERVRPARSEVMILQSDPSKAWTLLGWSARTTLSDGIARTASWLEQSLHLYDAEHYRV